MSDELVEIKEVKKDKPEEKKTSWVRLNGGRNGIVPLRKNGNEEIIYVDVKKLDMTKKYFLFDDKEIKKLKE